MNQKYQQNRYHANVNGKICNSNQKRNNDKC